MRIPKSLELVKLQCFIQATRDSGYKSAAFALAELVDNAIEAGADHVDIDLITAVDRKNSIENVLVSDDGDGMSPQTLEFALQFGGSTRFDSRQGPGRFGMGLPNSALSQARRVDVLTWRDRTEVWTTFLDVDQILAGESDRIPKPRRTRYAPKSKSGTLVKLSKCDRFQFRNLSEAEQQLGRDLGRLFRDAIFGGFVLRINGRCVEAFDPLFMRGDTRLAKATSFGPPIVYSVRIPKGKVASQISVTFVRLPLELWSGLTNQEKNRIGIAKGAGVSIVRAGREIDLGWFFMGTKRKENYDDWWRCEVRFSPELDELFGVTHTKQGIRPTEELEALLTPDLERIARDLNSIVRRRYAQIKAEERTSVALTKPNMRDHLLEPPQRVSIAKSSAQAPINRRATFGGLRYVVQSERSNMQEFYAVSLSGVQVTITLNELHPFYERIYLKMPPLQPNTRETPLIDNLKALLAAAARAELASDVPAHREIIHKFRLSWSDALVAFLS